MLIIQENEEGSLDHDLVMLAIDPGTDALGVVVARICSATSNLYVEEALTFLGSDATKHSHLYANIAEVHGDVYGRLMAIRRCLDEVIREYKPHICCTESPFLGRSIDGYAKLSIAVNVIRDAIIAYDHYVPIYYIPPQTMKSSIGAITKTVSKDGVLPAIIALLEDDDSGLKLNGNIDLSALSEHAVDAIGVAYCQYRDFITLYDLIQMR